MDRMSHTKSVLNIFGSAECAASVWLETYGLPCSRTRSEVVGAPAQMTRSRSCTSQRMTGTPKTERRNGKMATYLS